MVPGVFVITGVDCKGNLVKLIVKLMLFTSQVFTGLKLSFSPLIIIRSDLQITPNEPISTLLKVCVPAGWKWIAT